MQPYLRRIAELAPITQLRLALLVGLTALGTLVILGHLSLDWVIGGLGSATEEIRAAATLDSLVQEVAQGALYWNASAEEDDRIALEETVSRLRRRHYAVPAGDPVVGMPEVSHAFARKYVAPARIGTRMEQLFTAAESVARLPAQDPRRIAALADVRTLSGELADGLSSLGTGAAARELQTASFLRRAHLALALVLLAVLIGFGFLLYRPLLGLAERRDAELRHLATTDDMTGLANLRGLHDASATPLSFMHRHGDPLTVMVVNVDKSRLVSDAYGSIATELLLLSLATILRTGLRAGDVAGRIDGDEFVALLARADTDSAKRVAERLREAANHCPVDLEEAGVASSITYSVSIGLAEVYPEETDVGPALTRARTVLIRAKRQGRNRVVTAPAPKHGASTVPLPAPRRRHTA